ncbi:GNAT family N-acetyltransferase, partial [Streptomyces sp. NPDC057242]|uniref:GNAT family N-acetyltransferase n=1 Tax=Streptomyces sp. NPDC057242 TaxID=3346063 RepID=UPI00362D0710
ARACTAHCPVCRDPVARGGGHPAVLGGAPAPGALARGERPFLHVAEKNTAAIALYERLGFTTRKHVTFRGFRTP